jgi:hypothetical protein
MRTSRNIRTRSDRGTTYNAIEVIQKSTTQLVNYRELFYGPLITLEKASPILNESITYR